jgi:hypothetical protein
MNREEFIKEIKKRYGKTVKFTEKEFEMFCKLRQADKVWWHLKNLGSITNKICHEVYGIRHCPSVIRDIRDNPFTYGDNHFYIEDIRNNEPDRWGKSSNFEIYTLKQLT